MARLGERGATTPVLEPTDATHGRGGWVVTVFDNDHNTVEEVIHILMRATGCTLQEAAIETWEVHNLGKSVVHHAKRDECDSVAATIATIGIRTEVSEE